MAKFDNHAIDSGTVALSDQETNTNARTAMIERDGSFRFNYVPDGQYILRVTGGADTEKAAGGDADGPDFMRMMNSKTIKSYGDAEQPLVVKSDATGLVVQMPDAKGKTAPVE